jgi:hypothetical protein
MSSQETWKAPVNSKLLDAKTSIFLLGTLAFLYCFLFVPPFLPVEVNNIGDSLLYLAPGQRMYQGEMIYRDFFEFVTPGTALVNLAMFKLFGLRLWVPDALVLLLGLGLATVGIFIAKKLVNPTLALLPSGFFLAEAREYLCDPVHHWYSMLAAVAGIAVLIERRTPARIFAAGCLCGISASFTQTRGFAATVGFIVFLLWEAWQKRVGWRAWLKNEAWLVAGALASFLAVNGYFIWTAGPVRYFWCTVVYVLKYYPKEADWNTIRSVTLFFPTSFLSLHNILVLSILGFIQLTLTPVVFIMFFGTYWKQFKKKPAEYWTRPMLVATVGLFMYLSIAPSPNPNRMAVSSLTALIVLVWLLDSLRRFRRLLMLAVAGFAVLLGLHDLVRSRPKPAGILVTPQGRLALTSEDSVLYQEYLWIQQHTRPGDYFYEADFPDINYFLDLRNPTPIPRAVNNGYTTKEQVDSIISGLEQHPPQYIYWGTGNLDLIPKWEDPADAHLGPLRDYIRLHYQLVKVFDLDEIWEKKPE